MRDLSTFFDYLTSSGYINPPFEVAAEDLLNCSAEMEQFAEYVPTTTKILGVELFRSNHQRLEVLLRQIKTTLHSCYAQRLESDCDYILECLRLRGAGHCTVHIERLVSNLTAFSIAIQTARRQGPSNSTERLLRGSGVQPQQQPQSQQSVQQQQQQSLGNLLTLLKQALSEYDGEKSLGLLEKLENLGMSGRLAQINNLVHSFEFDKAVRVLEELQANTPAAGTNPRKRIILGVDDMPQNLSMLRTIIGDKYKFIGVTSGEAALRYLETNIPDVYILDIDMPKMNGYELVAAIRMRRKLAPIVFLTANATAEYVTKAFDMGITDFLVKPCNEEAVFAKLDSIFASR
ncbi:MAG: response regulator [Thermoguttaceae bacterium]